MLQLLNDSSTPVFFPFFSSSSSSNSMENVPITSSPRTSPTKISEIENDSGKHELQIFKTSKPIKDSPDDRALTSKKSKSKDSSKQGFFQKIGFGSSTSKSASVSPVKNLLHAAIPRRSSEIHDENPRKIQRKKVEAIEKSKNVPFLEQSKISKKEKKKQIFGGGGGAKDKKEASTGVGAIADEKNIKSSSSSKSEKVAATAEEEEELDENDNDRLTPISSYEDPPPPSESATGTESDARVSQTIIMKKRTLHEEKAEACILPYGNIIAGRINSSDSSLQPPSAHASANLDITQPQKASISATVSNNTDLNSSQKSPNIFTSCKPSMKQSISDSFTSSKKSLASINSSKVSSNATLSTAVSSSSSSSTSKPQPQNAVKSEFDLSAPLSRLGLTMAAEKNSEGSLAEKLSRSFFDLTQGSQDRLQKWKNKLQTGKRHHHHPKMSSKDLSEPPDVSFPGLSDMESILDWTATDKPKFVSNPLIPSHTKRVHSLGPRPLHPSRSATNANISSMASFDQDVYLSEGSSGMTKKGSFREANMEHRTLKPKENLIEKSSMTASNANLHYQNMKNLQQLVQTIEGYSAHHLHHQQQQHHFNRELDLPPPARILPYSGIKPQDNGIIRPIAFRPLNQSKESSSVSELAIKNRENSRSIGNLASVITPRQRNSGINGIPSTSSATNLFPLISSNSASKLVTDENDYDTVPEFIERKSDSAGAGDNYSMIYNFQTNVSSNPSSTASHPHLQHRRAQSGASSAGSGGGGFNYHLTGQSLTSSNSSSTTSGLPNSPPHSAGSSVKKSASRHSGLHITPSPSDSGIVDYETLIRDKESELTSVRTAMEQNEEVLVRVYQEKERQFRDQMQELRQKLQASQQGEAALRQQLRQSDDQRIELQRGFDNLSEEKQSLQKKCQQIERELYTIRNRFEDFVRDTKAVQQQQQQSSKCESCQLRQKQQQHPQIIYENGGSIASSGASGKAPVPAPRQKHEAVNGNDRQLRGEVDDLRGEISSLRDQLNNQMQMFAEERRRWEQERKNRSPSPKTQFRNASHEQRTAVLLSNDRLI